MVILQWREVDICMTCSYALEVKYGSPYSCSESPQHQTFLHEILRVHHWGSSVTESWAWLGWAAKHIVVSAYLCVHESARWRTHLLRNKFTYLFNEHLLSAYCALLGTYTGFSGRSCENKDRAPALQGTNISIQPRWNRLDIFLCVIKAEGTDFKDTFFKELFKQNSGSVVWSSPKFNMKIAKALCSISLVQPTSFTVTCHVCEWWIPPLSPITNHVACRDSENSLSFVVNGA